MQENRSPCTGRKHLLIFFSSNSPLYWDKSENRGKKKKFHSEWAKWLEELSTAVGLDPWYLSSWPSGGFPKSFQRSYNHSGVSSKRRYSDTYSWHCGLMRGAIMLGCLLLVVFCIWSRQWPPLCGLAYWSLQHYLNSIKPGLIIKKKKVQGPGVSIPQSVWDTTVSSMSSPLSLTTCKIKLVNPGLFFTSVTQWN